MDSCNECYSCCSPIEVVSLKIHPYPLTPVMNNQSGPSHWSTIRALAASQWPTDALKPSFLLPSLTKVAPSLFSPRTLYFPSYERLSSVVPKNNQSLPAVLEPLQQKSEVVRILASNFLYHHPVPQKEDIQMLLRSEAQKRRYLSRILETKGKKLLR